MGKILKLINKFKIIADKVNELSQKQLLIIAGLVSIIFAGFLYMYIYSINNNVQNTSKVSMVAVVTAKIDIPRDTIINNNMLTITNVPKNLLPANPVTDINEVVGKIVKVSVMAGDIITVPKLYSDNNLASFVGKIPNDCRAISISIDDVTGVAGFAKPGDYVDVIVVTNKPEMKSEIILQDVLLLGINKTSIAASNVKKATDKAEKQVDEANQKMSTATLAIKPYDALRLRTAASRGSLSLMLRPLEASNEFVADTQYSEYIAPENKITNNNPPPAPVNNAVPARNYDSVAQNISDNGKSITVIRGETKSKVEVR